MGQLLAGTETAAFPLLFEIQRHDGDRQRHLQHAAHRRAGGGEIRRTAELTARLFATHLPAQ